MKYKNRGEIHPQCLHNSHKHPRNISEGNGQQTIIVPVALNERNSWWLHTRSKAAVQESAHPYYPLAKPSTPMHVPPTSFKNEPVVA